MIKTNPANWPPQMNMNQEMYFARDVDPILETARKLLERMRSASSCDFQEMPYWANEVIKILNGEGSLEEPYPELGNKE